MKKALCVLGMLLITTVGAAPSTIGSWRVDISKDPITDATEYLAYSLATDKKTSLGFTCDNGSLIIGVLAKDFLNNDAYIPGVYRFDSQEPEYYDFAPGNKGVQAFLDEEQYKLFVKPLVKAKKFVVRLENYEGIQYTYTFNLNRTLDALKKLPCAKKYL